MTPERWQQVKELFHSALERESNHRALFLDEACAGDVLLRREVESLITSHEQTGSFIDSPAYELGAELLTEEQAETLVGQRIAHYEIVALLGSGGMGEVYLAHDTRLGREIALKLLPAQFTTDKDRLRRFQQEAHAASTLSHPNVCVIYEVGETEEGRHYIAMEYVGGVTLRQHMTEARLKLSEVLDVAVQVASGIAAAHELGVVHRDVKPENIMLRRDGYVKVLDFGLAKLAEQEVTDLTAAPGAPVKTDTGMVMGTSRYMSPEQVRGLAVDARTDIWSLGVVLYEMMTGCVPFEGATTSDVIVSILEREPPRLAQFSPEAPAELQRIISKALHKDREERYQTVKDLLIDVRSLKQDLEIEAKLEHSLQPGSSSRGVLRTSATTPAARPQPRWWANRLIWLSAALILVVGVAVRFYLSRAPAESSTRSSSKASLPPMKVAPFTSFSGREFDPTFSPDGNQIAFIWDGVKGDNFDIYVKLISAGTPLRLTTHPSVDHSPAWSPDGRYIAFFRHSESEQGIFVVPALGGTERKLYSPDWEPSTGVAGAGNRIGNNAQVVWSPDGKYLAFMDSSSPQTSYSIWLLSVENLERRQLTWPPPQYSGGDTCPAFSPDGQTLGFARWSSAWVVDIYIVPISAGEPRRLTFDNRPISRLAWTPDGREIVFSSARAGDFGLWRISVTGGTPERLAVGGDNASQLSISRQGNRLAYVQDLYDANIWRIELPNSKVRSNSPTKLIASTLSEEGPQYSPDGRKIVFESGQRGSSEIWVCDSDGLNAIQLTSYGRLTGTPRWSPDGRHIAFDGRIETSADIYVTGAEGGSPRRITTGTSDDVVPSWSRDGRWIYFASNRTRDNQVWKAPAEGGEAVQVTKKGGFAAFESPDGKFIYYAKGQSAPGIWRIPVEGGEETLVLDQPAAGYWGYWAVVDEGIYFVNAASKQHPVIEFFSFATRRVRQIAVMEKEASKWNPGFAISPDGRWILYTQVDQSDSHIMLVDNFQ